MNNNFQHGTMQDKNAGHVGRKEVKCSSNFVQSFERREVLAQPNVAENILFVQVFIFAVICDWTKK